jgi:transposase
VTLLELEQEVSALQTVISKRDQELLEKDRHIEILAEFVEQLQRKLFSPKSEKIKVVPEEQIGLGLFNEVEFEAKAAPEEAQDELIEVPAHKRGRGKRKPLPENLPRETRTIELSESERICPHDGKIMSKIGEEVSEKLDVIPMLMKVIRTVRFKYGCRHCEEGVKTAPVPPQALPKTMATEGLLAAITTWKYVDCLPLYRIEGIFKRNGVEISRGTMAHWMIKGADLATPLINLMSEDANASDYLNMDETRVQVLHENGKTAESLSYMWVRARPGPDPIILFDYDPTRSGTVPVKLLQDFRGSLQVDGYDGYNDIESHEGIIRYGCMAHVRRKFFDAAKTSKKPGIGNKAIAHIRKLYRIEDEIKGKPPDERKAVRQIKSKPILDEMRTWLTEVLSSVPPQSLTGKALNYAHNEWKYISGYVSDGRIEIDNNYVENFIRPFALGRKNWLFSDSVAGAKASAVLYSLVVSARANGIEPYSYLKHIFSKLPLAKTIDDIEALLPHKAKSQLNQV